MGLKTYVRPKGQSTKKPPKPGRAMKGKAKSLPPMRKMGKRGG